MYLNDPMEAATCNLIVPRTTARLSQTRILGVDGGVMTLYTYNPGEGKLRVDLSVKPMKDGSNMMYSSCSAWPKSIFYSRSSFFFFFALLNARTNDAPHCV